MSRARRNPPGSACHACRRLKMRCEFSIVGDPCARCRRNGRECLWYGHSTRNTTQTSLGTVIHEQTVDVPRMSAAPANESPSGDDHEASDVVPSVDGTLPSIYSTSQSATFVHDRRMGQAWPDCRLSEGMAVAHPEQLKLLDHIHVDDAFQAVDLFREKLLPTMPVLQPKDFTDAEKIIGFHTDLAIAIIYATTAFLPGYSELRIALAPAIVAFCQKAANSSHSKGDQDLVIMQTLTILYTTARRTALNKTRQPRVDHEVGFWFVKNCCETFAQKVSLHRAADELGTAVHREQVVSLSEPMVTRYLWWLWLYANSHNISVLTRTPPTIVTDVSIRAAPYLLRDLRQDKLVRDVLAEVELCLVWDRLGRKDPSIREWWCSVNLHSAIQPTSDPLLFDDVDAALQEWSTGVESLQSAGGTIGRDRSALTPLYFLRHTRFCLYTHFIRHIRPAAQMTNDDELAIQKCVQAACDFLALFQHLGPVQRDQIRYSPGLTYVTASFCASFILRAIAAFPRLFEDIHEEISLIRKVSTMMMEFGQGLGRGVLGAGETLQISLERTLAGRSEVAHVRTFDMPTPQSQGVPSSSTAPFVPRIDPLEPDVACQFPFVEHQFFDFDDWTLLT